MHILRKLPVPFLVFAGAFCFFAAFAPFGQVTSDTLQSVLTAESIVDRGSLAIAPGKYTLDLVNGVDGRLYCKYGIAYSATFIPAVVLAKVCSHIIPFTRQYILNFLLSFTNTFYAALIIALLFLLLSRCGYPPRIVLFTVACISTASLLLPYSKIVHSEIMATALMLVFLLAVSGKNVLSFRSCILLGAAIGLLPLIKIAYGINAFFFFLYAVRLFMRKRIALTGAIIVAVELLASALVLSGLNLIRFGTLFESGYGSEAARFSASLLPGLLGFLFSPSKSVFIYSPLIILCMAASGAMFKRNPGIVLLIWLLTIANLMLYSFWYGWEGGWSWGPRFMVPYVVLLHVFLAEVILRSRENKVYRWGLRILLVPSVLISLLGATISYQQVYTVFNEDYWSIGNAQPLIAITLWMHKGTGARELYTCTDFHVDPAHLSAGPLHELLRPDGTIDMEGRKTFRGLFTMWEGLYHTFGWHWARFFPILLLATAFYLWRLTIAAAYRQMTST